MQWTLFLLILMGQCIFLKCHLYEYHFIENKMTWEQAQKYCRGNYTDLAKVFDMEDIKRLNNSGQNKGEAWIGLRNTPGVSRTWHWSLPGVEYIENENSWDQSGRTENEQPGNCGRIRNKWANVTCTHLMWFICYDERNAGNKTLYLIQKRVKWIQAQNYCRYNHTDLASGVSQVDGEEMKKLNNENTKISAWIGLFSDTWRWSDGSNFSFRNWEMELFNNEQSTKTCTMIMLNKSGRWSYDECTNRRSFFCYDDKVILIKKNKTWAEALYHCRKHYHDLVAVTNHQEQGWLQEKAKNASTSFVWLGLRYTCALGFWFWVTDEGVCYKYWNSTGRTDDCDMSGAMDRGGQHKWFSKPDNKKFNFFCSTK